MKTEMNLSINLALVRKNKAAILKAADFITENRSYFDFMAGRVPENEKCCGCLLAWVGYFAGFPAGTGFTQVAEEVGLPDAVGVAAGIRFKDCVTYKPHFLVKWVREVVEFAEEE